MAANRGSVDAFQVNGASGNGASAGLTVAIELDAAIALAYVPPSLVLTDRRTRFRQSDAVDFTTTLPPMQWVPRTATVGGRLVAASGKPCSYLVRRDRLVNVTIRLYESEWTAFYNVMITLQDAGEFDWYPSMDNPDPFRVTLFAPMPGQRWQPQRLAEFPEVLTVELTLRGVGDVQPWRMFFGD